VSPAALSEIDKLISAGIYTSRSDFINQVIYEKLAEKTIEKELKDRLIHLIRTDPEVRAEISRI